MDCLVKKVKKQKYTKTQILGTTLVSLLTFFVVMPALAAQDSIGLGDFANNIFGLELGVRDIIRVVCVVAGGTLLLSSLLQYKKYRQNPIATPLGSVIFTFFVGVCLIILYFIPLKVG